MKIKTQDLILVFVLIVLIGIYTYNFYLRSDTNTPSFTLVIDNIENNIPENDSLNSKKNSLLISKSDSKYLNKFVSVDTLVSINEANLEELTTIPGVGIKTAERIVEYRKINGNFFSVDELEKVKGIGKKKIEKMKKYLKL
ncbi:MAG: helix-hairpin-helix domain-containing protein [Candidatus Delongbacteria bacterium]|nr:helix-hairpin-helix domain-containing protein [Candidatus Delongbacteria bacterium]MBN2834724.1 helix-hairpin-helix domain-containing protein [Candidatus Delongbacteria bacterium]